MIILDQVAVDESVVKSFFACDLNKCKGACCVEGESGAPLEKQEAEILETYIHILEPYMSEEGRKAVRKQGVGVIDDDGDLTTPLISRKGPCAFVCFTEDKTAYCAIEKAYKDKKIPFQKPLSCHLYPIRVERKQNREYLFYHRWEICKPACDCGLQKKISLITFVKDALIRKYGVEWYNRLNDLLREISVKSSL